MKKLVVSVFFILLAASVAAQQKTFDIVTYHQPVGYTQSDDNGYVAFKKTDSTQWVQMAIYKSGISQGDIDSDLDKEWEAVILALRTVQNEENSKTDTLNSWLLKSRSAIWKYQGTDVLTTLTVFSNGSTYISLFCSTNAQNYLADFRKLVASIKLNTPQSDGSRPSPSQPKSKTLKSSKQTLNH